MEAECQCSTVKFTCPLPAPTQIYICHCTHCRRQSASAFGISAIFPKFEIKSDHTKVFNRPTESGNTMHCIFCDSCGTRLMHHRDGVDVSSVKGGALMALTKEMMDSAIHIWTSEAIVSIPKDKESWAGEPPDD